MSLQTRITALVQAIGADIKALYSGKVGTSDPRLADAREWTASTVTQAEAEQGTATPRRAWTAQRVFQAVAAWWAASAMKTKLDGIATGATANATDAQLRDRSTHTGTQAISTVTGLQTALDGKINTSERGVSGGIPTLDQFARIPPSQLPSYVDDVLEYPTRQDFPATGEGGKIYIAINQGTAANPTVWWRWTGTTYVDIPPSPGTTDALVEGSTNLYFSESRVRNTVLTGLSLASSAAVAATDNVLAAFGKTQARLNLLGTAANANVQPSHTDTTAGGVMTVGAGGLLADYAHLPYSSSMVDNPAVAQFNQFRRFDAPVVPFGGGISRGTGILFAGQGAGRGAVLALADNSPIPRAAIASLYSGTPTEWAELFHTANFNPATKQDVATVLTKSATAQTAVLTDAGQYQRFTNTGASTYTIAPQSSVAWADNTELTIRRAAAANLTLAAGSGVTLNAPSGGTLVLTNSMTVTLKRVATNVWDVIGQTVAA